MMMILRNNTIMMREQVPPAAVPLQLNDDIAAAAAIRATRQNATAASPDWTDSWSCLGVRLEDAALCSDRRRFNTRFSLNLVVG